MGGAASVNLKEIDLSTRVASFEGVFGAIVIAAKKGSSSEPSLTTNDTQLLNEYTPDGRVEVGFDLAYFSALAFLERANKLWVMRAINTAYFAGAVNKEFGEVTANAAIAGGSNVDDPTAFAMAAVDALYFYASSEGDWGNKVGYKLFNAADDTADNELANDALLFRLEIYKDDNVITPVETFYCSRTLGHKDGRGRNTYVEDVLAGSGYMRAVSNPVVAEATLPKAQTSTVLLLGDGDDGLAVTDANMISAAQSAYGNELERSVTLIMDGGYSVPAYQIAIDTICKNRQDCVGIFTTPYADEVSASYITDLVDYRKTDLNLNSSYSALYTPHLLIADKFNDRQIWAAPDGHIAGSISFSSQNYEIWYPNSGFNRGVLNVLDTRKKFTNGEMDLLANNSINPVRFASGKGIVVWGQKTLLSKASALDRLNVRLLLIVIEPAIKDLLENFLFELNDINTRSIIEIKLESYLETIKAKRGITAFDVVVDDSNNSAADIDANRLNVDIFIRPTRSIEEIPVRVVITPESISFSDAAGSV